MKEQEVKFEQNQVYFLKQRYKYEGYPSWYQAELAKHLPINIQKFQQNYEQAAKFYIKEAQKLLYANNVLKSQLAIVKGQRDHLADCIAKISETKIQIIQQKQKQKPKRLRRCAGQIIRNYICQVQGCQKSYGTQGSMAQHMKHKHPQIVYNGICLQTKQVKIKQQLNMKGQRYKQDESYQE